MKGGGRVLTRVVGGAEELQFEAPTKFSSLTKRLLGMKAKLVELSVSVEDVEFVKEELDTVLKAWW